MDASNVTPKNPMGKTSAQTEPPPSNRDDRARAEMTRWLAGGEHGVHRDDLRSAFLLALDSELRVASMAVRALMGDEQEGVALSGMLDDLAHRAVACDQLARLDAASTSNGGAV